MTVAGPTPWRGRGGASLCALLLLALPLGAADIHVNATTGADTPTCGSAAEPCRSIFEATEKSSPGDTIRVAEGCYGNDVSGGCNTGEIWPVRMRGGRSIVGAGPGRSIIRHSFPDALVPTVQLCVVGDSPTPDCGTDHFGPNDTFSGFTLVRLNQSSPGQPSGIGILVTTEEGSDQPVITRNEIFGYSQGISLDVYCCYRGSTTTSLSATVTRNRIHGADEFGIQSYAYTTGADVTESSTITNNSVTSGHDGIFVAATAEVRASGAEASPTITNNTIYGGTRSGLRMAVYDGYGDPTNDASYGTVAPVVANNILAGGGGYGIEESATSLPEPVVLETNDLGGNSQGPYGENGSPLSISQVNALPGASGNRDLSPLLVDPSSGDAHQLAGSPSIDSATEGRAPAIDFDGQARPVNGAGATVSDIGADEYVPCTATADSSASDIPPPCSGGSILLDASVSTVDAICTAGLAYEWWDGAVLIGTQVSMPYDPPAATTITLRVVCDDPAFTACRDETSFPVAPPAPAVTADAGPAEVQGQLGVPVLLGGSPTATGGTPPYGYGWTPSPFPGLDLANLANPTFTPQSSGDFPFQVLVTDDAGCTGSDTITVRVPQILPLAADAGEDRTVEVGNPTVLGGSPTATGGVPPYDYLWLPNRPDLDTTDPANPTFTPAITGQVTFEVTVTDSQLDWVVDTVTIDVVDIPLPTADAGPDRTIQEGDPTVLGGMPSASGGTPPYSYEWSPTPPELNLTDPANPTFTPLTAGTYPFTLTVRDDRGMEDTDSVTVEVEEAPPGTPPGPVPRLGVRNECGTGGYLAVPFQDAIRADYHRLYAGTIGALEAGTPYDHTNPAAPEGCDDPTGDPDVPGEFRLTSGCASTPGGLYFLVVGVNDAGEGPFGPDDLDGEPATPGTERGDTYPPPDPACP